MPLLQTTTGFENFSSGSAKVYVFSLPTPAFPGNESNLHLLSRAGVSGVRAVGTATAAPAAPGVPYDRGKWTTQTFDIPEGMVLKVFANRSTSAFGQMRIMANMAIRMRAQGPLMRLSAILTQHQNATYTRANIEGRFDILTLEEALALGASIPSTFHATYGRGMTSRAFEITQMEREVTSRAAVRVRTIENSQGEAVVVTDSRRGRALDL